MAEKINVAELVEKMPPTDKELEAIEQAKKQPEGEKKPIPQNPESKFTGPDPNVAAEICEILLKAAPESVHELISMIKDPGSPEFKNYKAEYLTHILAVYTGRAGKQEHRKTVAGVFASYLGDSKTSEYVQGFLLRQLERIGDRDVVAALGKLLTNEKLCDYAAAALISIKDGAVQQFKTALPGCKGRCRLVAIQSLAALGDAESAQTFRNALKDEDMNIRLAGAWGIVKIADVRAIPDLLKAADAGSHYERSKMASLCIQLAEDLAAKGKKQEAAKIFTYLRDSRKDPKEKYIRDLAAKWLASTVL
jgi:HEAT repeat protein